MNLGNYEKNLVKRLLPNEDIVDVFLYDTKKDIDGGAWRKDKNAQMTTWYQETLNTATRGSKAEFPEVALIACYVDSGANKVVIYDAESLEMWMRFEGATSYKVPFFGSVQITSIFMLNGIIYGTSTGLGSGHLHKVNFKEDTYNFIINLGSYNVPISISNRNSTNTSFSLIGGNGVVNNDMNCVHGANINGIDYIAVATEGGLSIINNTTSKIYDLAGHASYPIVKKCHLADDGKLTYSAYRSGYSDWVNVKLAAHTIMADNTSAGYDYRLNSDKSVWYMGTDHDVLDLHREHDKLIVANSSGLAVLEADDMLTTRITKDKVVLAAGVEGSQGGRWITGFGIAVDESGGAIVDHKSFDPTGLTNNGSATVESTPSWGNLKGYELNGTTQYFSRANFGGAGSNVRFTGAFTLILVYKPSVNTGTQALFYKRVSGAGYSFRFDSNGVLRGDIYTSAGNVLERLSPTVVSAENVQLSIMIWDGSTAGSSLALWHNGVRVDSTDASSGTFAGLSDNSDNFCIGADSNGNSKFNGTIYLAEANQGVMSEEAIQRLWQQVQAIDKQSPALADMVLKGNSTQVNGVDFDDEGNIIYATGDGSNTGVVAKYDPDNLTHVETLSGITDSYGNAMTSNKFNGVQFLNHNALAIAGQSDLFALNQEKDLLVKDKDDKRLMAEILKRFPELQKAARPYELTVTGDAWTTIRAIGTPIKRRDGSWYLTDIQIAGSIGTLTPSVYHTLTIAGITFKSVTNFGQALAFGDANITNRTSDQFMSCWAVNGGGNIEVRSSSAFTRDGMRYYISGSVELDSKPNKTYFPFIDELDI